MKGMFELRDASDLLNKLHKEYELMQREPTNVYCAFNFFVTAEHLLDWLYPGKVSKTKREQVRDGSVLLQICSHIANGAKHFEVQAKHHQSVSDTVRYRSSFSGRLFAGRLFSGQLFPKDRLVIHLKGDAEQSFGHSISVLELAAKILDYWDNYPDL